MPRILIVKNYELDRQYSMLKYADMLADGLNACGWDALRVHPKAYFGKDRQTTHGISKWLGYADKYLLARKNIKQAVQYHNPDWVHIADHANAVYLPYFKDMAASVCCHDLISIRSWLGEIKEESKGHLGALQQRWIYNNLKLAKNIICVSQHTESTLNRLAPETTGNSTTIPMGLNYPYQPMAYSAACKMLEAVDIETLTGDELPEKWLLHVGGDSWYKNRQAVLDIHSELLKLSNQSIGLIMAGAPAGDDLVVKNRTLVAFLPHPANETLRALYSAAVYFIFPSFEEGFGWPPLEAQACGCPVAVSNIEPLVSNCGKSALLIDPRAPEKSAPNILAVINNDEQRKAISQECIQNARRFTTQEMIKAYDQYFRSRIDANSPPR